MRRFLALAAFCASCAAAPNLAPEQQAVIDHISAASLRGHLSFIASDLLEGRATPSRGLDLAAEYIAAQFRRAGLEPAVGSDYFQTATLRAGKAKNVIGLLRGSDPVLKDTYIVVSAHYDHLGIRSIGEDRIYNGANDDGSGTVSVIEIASALAALPVHPKRSVLFVAFFGEEPGLLGSQYYAKHPLVPLEKTIAEINLEQVGRTDTTNGPQVGVAYFTGFNYSDLGDILSHEASGAGFRIAAGASAKNEDLFERSDNLPFAEMGIPDGTLYVAADFPDYHRVTDEWQKIDYENMAKLDRALALGLLRLASDEPGPKWNSTVPAARKFMHAPH
ncbi:MAG: M28 family peptidase [Bryobacterales bacterium]|nr:M28 family peptidase [Bryobacterales bacterium]MBV9397073.1 M28 family peptidase [Bryobacterales bacterium]